MKKINIQTNKIVNRHDDSDKILSIMPIYDVIYTFNDLVNDSRAMANKFTGVKFVSEMNHIPEDDFQVIKDDLSHLNSFTDHVNTFYYTITANCVIIGHKQV